MQRKLKVYVRWKIKSVTKNCGEEKQQPFFAAVFVASLLFIQKTVRLPAVI
jgi:hypothetical protein